MPIKHNYLDIEERLSSDHLEYMAKRFKIERTVQLVNFIDPDMFFTILE